MSKKDYERYVNSIEWRQRTKRIKENNHYTCEICGNQILQAIGRMRYPQVELVYMLIPDLVRFEETFEEWKGKSPNCIVAHHKTYARLGKERDDDIATICVACHVVITENEPRLGLDGAWQFTVEYMAEVIEQIEAANKQILAEFKLDEELRREKRKKANAHKSFSWLRPPEH